ncbi:MAG: CHAD domain-containing protein [Gammaproteobacteria bacterium]|jgi:CHAD domain-containing protein
MVNLPRDTDLVDLRQRLARLGKVTIQSPVSASRQWLDTHDWRLHRSGQRLERWGGAADMRLRLSRIEEPADVIELPSCEAPAFAGDFSSAILRRRLGQVVSVRRLLPQCEMQAALQLISLHDERDKRVVRLELWRPRRRGELFVRVTPLRGYDAVAKRAIKRLLTCPGASAVAEDPLLGVTARLPVAPGQYPAWAMTRCRLPTVGARTDDVLLRQLAHFADIMALNIDGMGQALDSEFVHQFRVGLTRSRALLRNTPQTFAAGRVTPQIEVLGWMARETGAVRDADVCALVFPDYVAALRADERAALQPLLAFVNGERQRAQNALALLLASSQFRRRWRAWVQFANAAAPRASRQVLGAQPIAIVAPQLLAKRARAIERKGRQINAESSVEAYHNLRKNCKFLRYMIDAYSFYLSKPIPPRTIKRLKVLQELLGEYQDLDVHQTALSDLQRRMQQQDLLSVETHRAIEVLQASLRQRAERVRARFPEDFSAFGKLRLARSLRKSRSLSHCR